MEELTGTQQSSENDEQLAEMSLALSSDDEEPVQPYMMTNKRKRFVINDDDDDESNGDPPETEENDPVDSTVPEEDNAEGNPNANDDETEPFKAANEVNLTNHLKALCDDDSSNDAENATEVNDMEGDESTNQTHDEDSQEPARKREKNPSRIAKSEAENVISMIQRNAREDELTVPYHCPEQKSLKEFLESLKSHKATIIGDDKVELKTHKFKFPKDQPQPTGRSECGVKCNEAEGPVNLEESEKDSHVGEEPLPGPSVEKLTLKGDPNSLIDLETGTTIIKKSGAEKLIDSLMKHSRAGVSNDGKFKAEPVPGAPLKELKRNLETEMERKRVAMIQKIMKVEQETVDEEDILDDDEYELDSDDDTKKRRVNKDTTDQQQTEEVQFNEEEDVDSKGIDNEEGDPVGEDENDNEAEEEVANEDEEEEESESDSDEEGDDLDVSSSKRPLRRIVVPEDDSDDDRVTSTTGNEAAESTAPLFEDIPSEPAPGFEFSATQNENELFDLCSGKFATQIPSLDENPDEVVEASQVKDFQYPTTTEFTQENGTDLRSVISDEVEDMAGPSGRALILSSSEEEGDGTENATTTTTRKKLMKKKRRAAVIEEDDDDDNDNDVASTNADDEESEKDESCSDEEVEAVPEELQEYASFLAGGKEVVADGKGPRMKVADFIEKEAELSDSEWGSADEDERDMDQLEDIGLVKDDDNFDNDQLRDELGRIHMRQLANEDNRQLKYLKDAILNEEETDGQSRQRTFRWQNSENDADFNTSANGGEPKAPGEGENSEEDDEEIEAKWRRVRMEREKALQENKLNVTIQTKFEAVLKQAQDIRVVKPTSSELTLKENSSPSFLMQEQSKKFMNLRQSFLLRDEESLNRIAVVSAKTDGVSSVADGKQNFVFRRIETAPENEPPKKRKSNGLPSAGGAGLTANPVQKKRKL